MSIYHAIMGMGFENKHWIIFGLLRKIHTLHLYSVTKLYINTALKHLEITLTITVTILYVKYRHTWIYCIKTENHKSQKIGLHMGKKRECDTATLKVVESDVSLDKNCRKWRQNLIKIVEMKMKFIENEDRHESLIKYNYNIHQNINIL